MKATIYHNPRCSKSREALSILTDAGVKVDVVEYLKTPPSAAELKDVAAKLGIKPGAMVRTKEDEFKQLHLDLDDDKAVLAALAKHPVLLERPIVVMGSNAVIGRPPENVKKLLK
jgi:arsenate reductase